MRTYGTKIKFSQKECKESVMRVKIVLGMLHVNYLFLVMKNAKAANNIERDLEKGIGNDFIQKLQRNQRNL